MLQEAPRTIHFDLESRAQYLHPDRMERTVYVSPISANVTPDMLKVCIKIEIYFTLLWLCAIDSPHYFYLANYVHVTFTTLFAIIIFYLSGASFHKGSHH